MGLQALQDTITGRLTYGPASSDRDLILALQSVARRLQGEEPIHGTLADFEALQEAASRLRWFEDCAGPVSILGADRH